ncbi:hypothetical protein E2C01_056826 [Portunus trituberculatus]|uniref:Uncharacterized protein n=1 Tax=Portunus trituberculatus TaxID=210409 RepID=A0A5B7GZ98_PORTR|nr:hypothetical protein [Portunus trituberculatus]
MQHSLPNNCQFVVDGGYLLHSVVWPQRSTYRNVYQGYIAYVLNHYGAGITTAFDGYNTISTKATEQIRKAKKATSSDILFDQHMHITTTTFLANSNNKKSLIDMLSSMMT